MKGHAPQLNLPSGSRDAVLLLTLDPGSYSAVVTGANASSGSARVEVYEVPQLERAGRGASNVQGLTFKAAGPAVPPYRRSTNLKH